MLGFYSRQNSVVGCIIHANTLTTHYSYVCEPLVLTREVYKFEVEIIPLKPRLSDYVPRTGVLSLSTYVAISILAGSTVIDCHS